jgi:hypothetical protein
LFPMPCQIILQPLPVFRSVNCLTNYYLTEADGVQDDPGLGRL